MAIHVFHLVGKTSKLNKTKACWRNRRPFMSVLLRYISVLESEEQLWFIWVMVNLGANGLKIIDGLGGCGGGGGLLLLESRSGRCVLWLLSAFGLCNCSVFLCDRRWLGALIGWRRQYFLALLQWSLTCIQQTICMLVFSEISTTQIREICVWNFTENSMAPQLCAIVWLQFWQLTEASSECVFGYTQRVSKWGRAVGKWKSIMTNCWTIALNA